MPILEDTDKEVFLKAIEYICSARNYTGSTIDINNFERYFIRGRNNKEIVVAMRGYYDRPERFLVHPKILPLVQPYIDI